MFSRATSMPASTSSRIFSGVATAGPRVHTILALRTALNLASVGSFQAISHRTEIVRTPSVTAGSSPPSSQMRWPYAATAASLSADRAGDPRCVNRPVVGSNHHIARGLLVGRDPPPISRMRLADGGRHRVPERDGQPGQPPRVTGGEVDRLHRAQLPAEHLSTEHVRRAAARPRVAAYRTPCTRRAHRPVEPSRARARTSVGTLSRRTRRSPRAADRAARRQVGAGGRQVADTRQARAGQDCTTACSVALPPPTTVGGPRPAASGRCRGPARRAVGRRARPPGARSMRERLARSTGRPPRDRRPGPRRRGRPARRPGDRGYGQAPPRRRRGAIVDGGAA